MVRSLFTALFIGIIFACLPACKKADSSEQSEIDYPQEMRNFVQHISAYAKLVNSSFVVIPQNGVELISDNTDDTGNPDLTYINAIDGIGQESLLYGYDTDDVATPTDETNWMKTFIDMATNNGTIKVLVTDYCSTQSKMDDSYNSNYLSGYISFAADHRELDNIPSYPSNPYNVNPAIVTNLQSAQNFLYLINPDSEYSSAQAFISAVKQTNYDIVIMDGYYNGQAFTSNQIAQLKQKANGGQRMLICYMSIGEAENYRYYWQSSWATDPPEWLDEENPDWAGNYKVKYWQTGWQNIVYGNDSAYLDKILDVGFDGVYLDIIDAFEYYEGQ